LTVEQSGTKYRKALAQATMVGRCRSADGRIYEPLAIGNGKAPKRRVFGLACKARDNLRELGALKVRADGSISKAISRPFSALARKYHTP
jgi:hypothetical protein